MDCMETVTASNLVKKYRTSFYFWACQFDRGFVRSNPKSMAKIRTPFARIRHAAHLEQFGFAKSFILFFYPCR